MISDLYLMKKKVILKKMQATMEISPPFINHFSLIGPEEKRMCGIESHEKEAKYIYALFANLLSLRLEGEDTLKYRCRPPGKV